MPWGYMYAFKKLGKTLVQGQDDIQHVTEVVNYLTLLVGREVLVYCVVLWRTHVGDSREDGRDSCFDPATLRSREVDLGCEEHTSRVAQLDLRLLHNFQAGTELTARDWQSQ